MAMLTLSTITLLIFTTAVLTGIGKWAMLRENRKLKQLLKDGCEYEAVILQAMRIKPLLLSTKNVRLKVQILAEKPIITEFDYDASFFEWRELVTGKIITVDIDPNDPTNIIITRKSSRFSDPARGIQPNALLSV